MYIVPSSFTRAEKPTNYAYTDKKYYGQNEAKDIDDNIHNKRRTARTRHHFKYEFNLTNELPSEPHDSNIKYLQSKIVVAPHLARDYEVVKKVCGIYIFVCLS